MSILEWITDPAILASLVTLTALEIVLGIDNIVFISVIIGKLRLSRRSARGRSASDWRSSSASFYCRCSSSSFT